MEIIKERWGTLLGNDIYLYTLKNAAGSIVQLTNYGARIVRIKVPDKMGCIEDVVLGFDTLTAYLQDKQYMGATIGRFANRIADARFKLDDQIWTLEANEGKNSNHSGGSGFDHRVFGVTEISENTHLSEPGCQVIFSLEDRHGNGGFPGNLQLKITYCWAEQSDKLAIHYEARSDQKGILNLTNHSYFNLSGRMMAIDPSMNCLGHHLEINARKALEVSDDFIPTGRRIRVEHEEVSGLIFNQCKGRKDAVRPAFMAESRKDSWQAHKEFIQPEIFRHFEGINCCFELKAEDKPLACRLICDESGRQLEVETSYPGLLVYTGDGLTSELPGYIGRCYKGFDGVALECQYYPDSPNQLGFPPAIIEKDKPYKEFIIFKFSVESKSN